MGQCQQCRETIFTGGDTVCAYGPSGETSPPVPPEDLVVQGNTDAAAQRAGNELLPIWKWDEKPVGWNGQDPSIKKDDGMLHPASVAVAGARVPANPASSLGRGQTALARHLLFAPHHSYQFGKCYRRGKRIGSGTYGNVYEAVVIEPGMGGSAVSLNASEKSEQIANPRKVAVKVFEVAPSEEDAADRQKMFELSRRSSSFEVERAMLAHIEHPHVVKMHECFEEKGYMYIVLELCRGGELYERIAKKVTEQGGRGFDDRSARHLFRQMLYGVGHLHANRVVHRDIKTENFLLLAPEGEPEQDVLKLCDFGTAVRLTPTRPRSNGRVGTLSYMAPEVYANRGADVPADVWSLGVVLYLILVGANPFRNSQTKTKAATARRIESGDFDQGRPAWRNLSEDARQLVKSLLVLEEERRLTCVEALRHTWVEKDSGPQSGGGKPMLPARPDPKVLVSHASTVLMLLTRFAALDFMQRVVLTVCAQSLSDRDLADRPKAVPWYQMFIHLDADSDGRLSFEELARGLNELLEMKVSHDQLVALIAELDTDDSSYIEWGEWLALGLIFSTTSGSRDEASHPLDTAFRLLDRLTGDKVIDGTDVLAVLDGGPGIDAQSRAPLRATTKEQVRLALTKWVGQGPFAEGGDPQGANLPGSGPELALDEFRRVFQSVGLG